ncbi:UNVERIFIED_CONTAM: tRNA pseudouridine(38/39) synthase [Sesamum radiatum]|uniref:tRNA pseudouridine(38/39) synthase n=1 Tax=Sesamum radiatum TaxID=300843 RepID=A0AAW2QFM7_SESRA
MKMEENSNTELVESLRIQMESLRRRIHELEAENDKLSVQLGNCVCQKVIDELLDVERMPRKPQYTMAPEIPLVLQSCEFEGLKFRCSSDARQAFRTHFKKECQGYKLKAAIFHEALLSSSCDLYENNQLNNRTKKKESTHIPLMSRPTEPSYEERRAKLDAGAQAK